jgi:hypothetical protein
MKGSTRRWKSFRSVHALASTSDRLDAASFGGGLMESTVTVVTPIYRGLQVDLTPLAAARLVGVPAHEVTARLLDVGDLFGGSDAGSSDSSRPRRGGGSGSGF